MLSAIGTHTERLLEYLGGVSRQTKDGFYWTFIAPFRGARLRWGSAVHQMVLAGVNALPVICLIAYFIGLIMALQGAYEMKKFGAMRYVVDLVGVSMTRELGPLMTAIIVIGRSGSSFAAELGTMKVSEEVDALVTMGLNPINFLLVPKFLAMMIMMPCLTTIADLMGILGGASFAYSAMDMGLRHYLLATAEGLVMRDVVSGLIKSIVFGMVIVQIGCYEGFTVTGGPEGVGRSTTASVVISIFSVVVVDVVFTAFFYLLG